MSGDFSEYRKVIDRIDDEILRLLNERSKSVVEIGKLKKQKDAGANLHTSAREAAKWVLSAVSTRSDSTKPSLKSSVMSICSA
jgi:chorismate mutase